MTDDEWWEQNVNRHPRMIELKMRQHQQMRDLIIKQSLELIDLQDELEHSQALNEDC